METVPKNLVKLANTFFASPDEARQFIEALQSGQFSRAAVIWLGLRPEQIPFELAPKNDLFFEFVDQVAAGQEPGKSQIHEDGGIYCLDTSSVFAATVLCAIEGKIDSILDVCASPGGKAITAWRYLKPNFLLCNEVINKRSAALIHNLKRCKILPVGVTCFDPNVLAKKYSDAFDLVIVDAPCSGQSLIAKGLKSSGAFHKATINLNSNRQKRILQIL